MTKKPPLADQGRPQPTNKVLAVAGVMGLFSVYAEPVVSEVWPQIVPPVLAGQSVTSLVAALASMFVGMAAAYWVPDRANVPRE